MKILGIDDNEDLLELCESFLNTVGHEFIGINNGKEGLQAIKDKKFDVVLLDLSMPEFSGSDVIDDLAKEDIIKKQKVVVFTAASPTKEEVEAFLEKGAHSILKKPVDPDELAEFIHKIESEK